MKMIFKVALGAAIITAAGFILKMFKKSEKTSKDFEDRLMQVADEGYETAHDILFPGKSRKDKKKLHYGPVIPV